MGCRSGSVTRLINQSRRLAQLGLAVTASLIAMAPPTEAAYRCALRPDRCEIVYRELRYLIASEMRDAQLFQHMLAYPRRIKIIERSTERTRQRLRSLDRDVANEVGRLRLCDSADRLAAIQGRNNVDPQCADQL